MKLTPIPSKCRPHNVSNGASYAVVNDVFYGVFNDACYVVLNEDAFYGVFKEASHGVLNGAFVFNGVLSSINNVLFHFSLICAVLCTGTGS